MEGPSLTSRIPFGSFVLDQESGELLKNGRRIRLQAQPFQVLRLLLEKPGRVVTREELQRQLWPRDTFVDFEHGLNAAINRLRQVLDDSADTPRYIETLPRRGYRFIYPIDQPLPNGIQPRPSPSPSWIARAWSLISHNPALLPPAKSETAMPDEIEVPEAQVSPGGNPLEELQAEDIREEERERPAEVNVEKSPPQGPAAGGTIGNWSLVAGQRLGAYVVLSLLAKGGMGEVYLAEDTKLARQVALKVLPDAFSSDAERLVRFAREAKLLASLNHPNIAAIYGLEQAGSKQFLVLELVEGETLAKRLTKGRLSLEEGLEVCLQIAEAVEAAHEKGIIHRDLKPANIIITPEGKVKILDFGLAKVIHSGGQSKAAAFSIDPGTIPGVVMGTCDYMSPEQVLGQEVDQRTDLFSLGVVFYSMTTGRLPFSGVSPTETLGKILHTQPEAMAKLNPEVPEELQRIVRKCLEKDRDLRYQHASDLHADLKRLKRDTESGQAAAMKAAAGSPRQPVWKLLLERRRALVLGVAIVVLLLASALIWKWIPGFQSKSRTPETPSSLAGEQPSIVVLPFDDTSPGHDGEYFANGLSDKIRGDLSQIRALKVISKKTAEAFKEAHMGLRAIAEQYKVRYALEGSVAKAGNNLRISAQLIDATSDTHLWAGQYPGTLDNVFDMQEKVARAIVDGLKLRLTPVEERQIARRPITNVQAYDTYLRARNVLMQFTAGPKLDEALQLLEQSLKLNGDNAVIYAGLGYVHYEYANFGFRHEESVAKAEAFAEQALRLDPENAEALVVLGNIDSFLHGDPRQGVRHFKQALSIDPNNLDALFWLLIVYLDAGYSSAEPPLLDKLMEIDPLSPAAWNIRGSFQLAGGQYELAVESYRRILERNESPAARFNVAFSLTFVRRYKEALTVLELIGPTSKTDVVVQFCHLLRLALQGKKEKMPELLSPEFVAAARRYPLFSYYMAYIYAMVDEWEQALDWLENAVNRGFINYPFLNEHEPFLANLRGEPRFQKLMVRVKKEWKDFESWEKSNNGKANAFEPGR